MKKLGVVIEVAQWICIVILVFVVVWFVTSCVSIISKGDVEYDSRTVESQVGTNIQHKDVDLDLRP